MMLNVASKKYSDATSKLPYTQKVFLGTYSHHFH